MRVRLAAFLLLSTLALPGCFGWDDGTEGTTDPPTTPNAPVDETDNAVFYVMFEASEESTIEVPFPTLDSCRGPEQWMAGNLTGDAVATVHAADEGRDGPVLSLTGNGSVEWTSQISPGPPCQTLRHDPWSIEPDPEGTTTEMRIKAGVVQHAMVVVRLVRGGCGNATMYEGSPGGAWTPLDGHDTPVGC